MADEVWVDEGVAPLVLVLSRFEGVNPLESAGGGEAGTAFVRFRVERESREVARLASDLAARLRTGGVPYELSARWVNGDRDPVLELSCADRDIAALAEALAPDHRSRQSA